MDNFNEKLLKSLLTDTGPAGKVEDVLAWMKMRNNSVRVDVKLKPFSELDNWCFSKRNGDLEHCSGKFFAIRGLRVKTEGCCNLESAWSQPIIDQPEVGFLGIIAKKINGVLCFLLQAKIEPGNINNVQLSPTLQATRSNYTQVHQGKKPRYLEYFKNARKYSILVDQLQSEQGGRFLRKRNRNIIIEVNEKIPEHEDFIWLTLGQIKELMLSDNIVNMDTRTVFSGLAFGDVEESFSNRYLEIAELSGRKAMAKSELMLEGELNINEILSWLSEIKSRYSLEARLMPLQDVDEWNITENEIVRSDRRFFRVVGAEITIENREVSSWHQPLVQPMQEGICAFIIKKIDGIMHFLVQAKVECGNLDIVELAPTVQCLTGNYRDYKVETPPYLKYVLNANPEQTLFDVYQSEEGGRFYQEQNRNVLIEAGDDFEEKLLDNYCWMTLGQLKEFLRYNNYLNIQTRGLLAALNVIKKK